MKRFLAQICGLFLACAGIWLRAEEPVVPLVLEPRGTGEFSYDPRTGTASAANGVTVRYGNAWLAAQKVVVNQTTGEVLAEGNVYLDNDGQIWSGDRIVYNFKTRHLSTGEFKTGQRPFYISGPGLDVNLTNRIYAVTNAMFTADDYAEPGYTIHAREIKVVPGKYIEASKATVRIGNVPVFYWPYMRRSMEQHPNYWVFTPGYRSLFGAYLLSAYHMTWKNGLDAGMNLDYRVRRGFGVGPDITLDNPTWGQGVLRYYFMNDQDPGKDPVTLKPIDSTRQRAFFSYLVTPATNLTVRSMVRYQSDPYIVRDFYETEYRENAQPSTFFEVNKDWANWTLNLYAQPRVNDYQDTIERLPQVKLSGMRQQLGISPFFYESESSFGYYRHLFPTTNVPSPDITLPENYAAARGDTYHQVIVPFTLFGWLNMTPRMGERLSWYSKATGPGAMTDDETRAVFNTGMETSFKVSRVWRGTRNSLLDLNGLRHIAEPSVNYAFIPSQGVNPSQLPQFDTQVPGYWPLPLDYPDFPAIDQVDSRNLVRLSLRNRLQTKRSEGLDNLMNWTIFTDYRFSTPTNENTFGQLYSFLDIKPRSWMSLGFLTRYDLDQGRLYEQTQVITLQPGPDWSFSIGYRYREENEFGASDTGSSLILSSIAFRLSENWALRATHQYSAQDGVMEEQSYSIYRDFRSWSAALSFRYRDNRTERDDFTVAVTFSFKAFPRYGLNKEVDRPSLLLGS